MLAVSLEYLQKCTGHACCDNRRCTEQTILAIPLSPEGSQSMYTGFDSLLTFSEKWVQPDKHVSVYLQVSERLLHYMRLGFEVRWEVYEDYPVVRLGSLKMSVHRVDMGQHRVVHAPVATICKLERIMQIADLLQDLWEEEAFVTTRISATDLK